MIAGINDAAAGRALSITGTYGTGKSSLALFLDALLGQSSFAQQSADKVLSAIDPALYEAAVHARSAMPGGAIVCAAATAQREPVSKTLLRALQSAVERMPEAEQATRACKRIRDAVNGPDLEILPLLDGLAREHAVLLIIDEFGKNLEEFVATGGRDADLFVLQSIAEWTADSRHYPVILLTLQHLAFTEYDVGGPRGREWSKIQGRFVDIPYVETAAETQALIASVHTTTLPGVMDWSESCKRELNHIGVADLLHLEPAEMYPLHPTLVAALPALCNRYGQNERTLFSFLAGPDAHAVPSFIATTSLPSHGLLPSVRLHHAYDFFLASAATMVGASPNASRWIEIETRLRDIAGLTDPESKVLKTVGVLNLVAAGGPLRASRSLVRVAVLDGQGGTESPDEVDRIFDSLIERGLLTYREFADEYRVWSGSDYDLKSAIELARREALAEPVAAVLNRVRPQVPVVAARHSQEYGVLRVFARYFVDMNAIAPSLTGQDYDGLVLLAADPAFDANAQLALARVAQSRPVVLGVAAEDSLKALVETARDLAAHQDALGRTEDGDVDWVARRELAERAAAAAARLDAAVEAAYGVGANEVRWYICSDEGELPAHLVNSDDERRKGPRTLSAVLSDVCDQRYRLTPRVRNEMLSRRVLTSQGAKARRDLIEAMIEHPGESRCGIDGYGPERAMYEAVLARTGIHRINRAGHWEFGPPAEDKSGLGYTHAWRAIVDAIEGSADIGLSIADLYARLIAPPIGLKEGPIPVLLTAALIESANNVAIYENGTFLTRLDTPAAERLIRNPESFRLRKYAISGMRLVVTGRLSEVLGTRSFGRGQRVGAVVGVAGVLLGRARALPPFAQKTRMLSEQANQVRSALFSASDPEDLIFEMLPKAVGVPGFGRESSSPRADDVESFVDGVVAALDELHGLYPALRDRLVALIGSELGAEGNSRQVRKALQTRFIGVKAAPLETNLQTFLHALVDDALDDDEWAEYVGMLLLHKPPQSWTDEDLAAARARATSLCRQLRHVESIHFDRAGLNVVTADATPLRVGITLANGEDVSRVLLIEAKALGDLDEVAGGALAEIEARLGAGGREALLARLAETVLGTSSTSSTADGEALAPTEINSASPQERPTTANGRLA
ncbi:hypothetical protein ONA91_25660 [Micromonospora sp. DR5-3]|uniref:hypothetical protein n=1 Tax=unclassified Micromonospora TaxID=2617518 RepID=UPI0011D5D737|nr:MULTISPECIES: hypothetical protein [unclassified Micromonospora]MCW3817840.1 hypothetical protein [Micromonospora sp. DR5-3]TYC19107.1 hypothetical protein FXF52_38395 [Micromonospora sp. MP36]